MSMGVYSPAGGIPYCTMFVYKVCQRCDIHTGVGFCVARSTTMGNAKASSCGTSGCKTPTLFSCIKLKLNKMLMPLESSMTVEYICRHQLICRNGLMT